ncbi:MAG: N-acyl homoserine lactonase family protein [Dehalococcoidia bacterium]|nr:N-acyl homoserine lactonase family protein [Dehalococcoidia bacterium]
MNQVNSHIGVEKGEAVALTEYSIWAMTSGIIGFWPKNLSYVWDHANAGTIGIPVSFNLIVGGGRVMLFDTGWEDPNKIEDYGVMRWEPITLQLDRLGLKPDDVDTIVLSHLHLDHCGQVRRFPRAKIFVQRAEMDFVDFADNYQPGITRGRFLGYYPKADRETIRAVAKEGRLVLIEGYHDLTPGLKLVPALNTHTAGCQMLLVNTAAGQTVLTGDTAYSRNNIIQAIPSGTSMGSAFECLLNFERIMKLADGNINRVVNTHDPDMFSYWPSWRQGETQVTEIALAPGQRSLKPT